MIFLFLLVFFGWLLAKSERERRQERVWAKADAAHDLLFRKYLELCDDPTMTRGKWLEWIEVFEFSDQELAANNPHELSFNRLTDFARQWL